MNSQVEVINRSFPDRRPSPTMLGQESDESLTQQVLNSKPIPLSLPQQRLWFLQQINPDTAAHNLAGACRLRGPLNLDILQPAVDELICRHQSLRTSFAVVEIYAGIDGQPRQVIHPTASVPLSVVDLSHLPSDERERQALQVAQEESLRPFRLSQLPLFRVSLLRLSQEEHILLLVMHQMIGDDWSLELFFRELGLLYAALNTGSGVPLLPLPMQYADYALRQRESLAGGQMAEALGYWRQKLAGAPAQLALPTDRVRPPVQGFRGARQCLTFSHSLIQQLKQLSRQQEASLLMVLLTAFKVLLHRYGGQQDLVIGMPITGRQPGEIEGLIGPFVNTLVLRTDLSGEPTFVELLGRVREVLLGAFAHQEVRFENLVEELRPERNLSYNPLFQVSFNLRERDEAAHKLPGLEVSDFEFDNGIAQLDLALEITEKTEGLDCLLAYSTDLFDETTIKRMLGHYRRLLESVTDDPQQQVSSITILTDAEWQQLVIGWNDTWRALPQPLLAHEMFEQQAKRTPDAVAISFEEQQITYGELDRKANQLARYLTKKGAGPDRLIGICVERSLEMVVGLFGILKAGAAYVPLDPTYPKQRLAFMLDDAAVNLLLTQKHLLERLPMCSAEKICLGPGCEEIAEEREEKLESRVRPDNLAYVIYTSGSTGKPKGVMIPHHGLVNYLYWSADAYEARQGRGTLVHSPLGFDLTVTSLLVPLVVGRTAFLVREQPGVEALATALRGGSNFGIVKITPAHLEMLSQLLPAEEVSGLVKALVIGGEALLKEQLSFWHVYAPHTRLINEYGPTETVVGCCVYEVRDLEQITEAVPIGRPIANTQLYILNQSLEPVPVNITGHLYIGGSGLARGYLNRPVLTAEKFIPNPFSDEAGSRMYATGDLARYLPDGNIEFIGRMDQQVKVRGYRIELGEIEVLLSSHPCVRESVVVAKEDESGGKRLVAYIVAEGDPGPTAAEMRHYLKERLPEYMVPAVFVRLNQLPLTPSGKVDRRSLPIVDENRIEPNDSFVAPRNAFEAQLVKLMEKVLGVHPIGIRDNFFELGGHSLQAVRLFAQIENRFGKNLPLSILFHASTVEQLAEVLRQKGQTQAWSSLVAIRPTGSKPPLFCVHAAGANILIYRPLAQHLDAEQPVYALQAQGLDGESPPLDSIEEMAARYIQEIRAIQSQGPYFLLGASFGGLVAYEMAQRLSAGGETVAFLALLDTDCPVRSLLKRIRCHIGNFVHQGPRAYGAWVAKALQDRGGRSLAKIVNSIYTAPEKHSDDRRRAFDVDPLELTVLANLLAQKNYKPAQKAYPGKITFFMAEDCGSMQQYEDNRLGWGKIAVGGFEVHTVPGNHLTMREEPYVAELASKLSVCLGEAWASMSNQGEQTQVAFKMEKSEFQAFSEGSG